MVINDKLKKAITAAGAKYGTPIYVYLPHIIEDRIRQVYMVFKGIDFTPTFAVKANYNPSLLGIIGRNGFGMDIITPGELASALMAGVAAENIVVNGCGKKPSEMAAYLKAGVGAVNIDSIEEIAPWKTALKDSEHRPEFFVRLNSEVDAMTHPFISTGLKKHKFGVPLKLLDDFFAEAARCRIKIIGFHIHIGSQITEVSPYYDALSQICNIASKRRIKKINIGGGWGIDYTGDKLDLEEYRRTVVPLLKKFKITCEMGRFIVAESGLYVTRAVCVKNNGYKNFVVTDGGMNHLIRPAMYGAIHEFEIIGKVNERCEANYDIVGPLCETGDVLYRSHEGCLPETGALMVFKNAGAYGFSMSSNYNSTLRPAEVLINERNEIKLIRKAETMDDFLAAVRV
jgi:diaminopimelate decarboxylase